MAPFHCMVYVAVVLLIILYDLCRSGTINCNGSQECKSQTITCVSNEPCIVYCTGVESCASATINGASSTSVQLVCSGDKACTISDVYCGNTANICSVNCDTSDGNDLCKDMAMDCGISQCEIYCAGPAGTCDNIALTTNSAQSFQCTGPDCTTQLNNAEFTASPTPQPSDLPSPQPSKSPSPQPSIEPSPQPTTKIPSSIPTSQPTIQPTLLPSQQPTLLPTLQPTKIPTTDNPTTYVPTTRSPTKNPLDPGQTQPPSSPSPITSIPTGSPTTSVTTITPSIHSLESTESVQEQIDTTEIEETKDDNPVTIIIKSEDNDQTLIIIILSSVCSLLFIIILVYIFYRKRINDKVQNQLQTSDNLDTVTQIDSEGNDNDDDIDGLIDLKGNKNLYQTKQQIDINADFSDNDIGENNIFVNDSVKITKGNDNIDNDPAGLPLNIITTIDDESDELYDQNDKNDNESVDELYVEHATQGNNNNNHKEGDIENIHPQPDVVIGATPREEWSESSDNQNTVTTKGYQQ